jgi:hypothetical protein
MRRRRGGARLLWTVIAGAVLCPAVADGQASPTVASRQLQVVDSLAAAEFAKDSIGSITVGVIAGSALAWTRSYGRTTCAIHIGGELPGAPGLPDYGFARR